jgi:hypothetical protein
MYFILGTWLNKVLGRHHQTSRPPHPKKLVDYLKLDMPGLDEKCHTQHLIQLEQLPSSKVKLESEEAGAGTQNTQGEVGAGPILSIL